jgi:hypothetical protein
MANLQWQMANGFPSYKVFTFPQSAALIRAFPDPPMENGKSTMANGKWFSLPDPNVALPISAV